jgi:protein-tyrosine phosphatase
VNTSAAVLGTSPVWRRSVLWLLLLGPFFFLSYGYANHLAARHGVTDSFYFQWERQIPFLPWTIVPYWSIDLLYGFSFLCCLDAREVDRHAQRLLGTQLISVAGFILYPLRYAFEKPAADGLFGALFSGLGNFDLPYNQAPSLHIGLLVLIWVKFAGLRTSPLLKLFIHGWALLIGLSVLTTWQHHFIDVPTGATVGLFCLWLWPDGGDTASPLKRGTDAEAGRLAAAYALAALLLFLAARAGGGIALLLCWPALSLLLVAFNYAWAGANGFQKSAGRHSLAVRLLFAPYLLGARLNARLWTLRNPRSDSIAEGVWLGRLPDADAMQSGGFSALLDLTAELPAPRGPWRYANLPWLDMVTPTQQQLIEAAERIETLRGGGQMLVACALGYSRSAAAVATWLRLYGGASTMANAVAQVRARRPGVVLGPALLAALDDAETWIASHGHSD